MFDAKRSKIKKLKWATMGLVILLLFPLPAYANPRGDHFWGFGLGLLTGYLFAPRPVYVAPPVYASPPEVAQVYPSNIPEPPIGPVRQPELVPSPPSTSGYTGGGAGPAPGNEAKCREWRMIDRHLEDRWDSYYGKWRQVPVEKWGWVEVPCSNKEGEEEVRGSIKFETLPTYSFPVSPQLAVIPGTYIYFIPDIGPDFLLYQGYWYRTFGGRWYWAQSYNGPWGYLAFESVPRILLELPPGYRQLSDRYPRVSYEKLQANWRRWEHERYWHKDRKWQEGWTKH